MALIADDLALGHAAPTLSSWGNPEVALLQWQMQVLVYGVNLLHRTLYRLHTDQLNSMQQCKELSQRLLTLSMHVPVLVMETFCMYSVLFDVPFE